MTSWSVEELDRIGGAEELAIAPRRADGSLRRPLPIWVVRVGDDLYVRSWRGPNGRWFRAACASREGHITAGGVDRDVALLDVDDQVNDAIDDAYRAKYGRHSGYVEPMIAPPARATTLKLVPRGRDRPFHTGGPHRLAYPSVRADHLRHRGSRSLPARGGPD